MAERAPRATLEMERGFAVDTHTYRRDGALVRHRWVDLSSHWTWLVVGFLLAFAVPFLLADVAELDRDVYYGLDALSVLALFAGWSRGTGFDLRAAVRRRWPWAVGLGLACAAALAAMAVVSEDAGTRPGDAELAWMVFWRGVVYGATDGLLLSSFPILLVFAGFAGSRLRRRRGGVIAVGAAALVASLAMTAIYHAGYSDFRSEKMTKPIAGDVIWSLPTLATLNPVGAPIAHIGLHASAVLHDPQTETFLPPHE
jgi:hypothetical protein